MNRLRVRIPATWLPGNDSGHVCASVCQAVASTLVLGVKTEKLKKVLQPAATAVSRGRQKVF